MIMIRRKERLVLSVVATLLCSVVAPSLSEAKNIGSFNNFGLDDRDLINISINVTNNINSNNNSNNSIQNIATGGSTQTIANNIGNGNNAHAHSTSNSHNSSGGGQPSSGGELSDPD